ncbi:MAG: protein-glutamate O-methyltransferase CheR [Thermotogae bacterium]|nr:protein-glutamate O-methyltransferase CheR [Thermotogota bacterium]MCP5465706.1 protein-glutamate O-methyltransferase CheR [Thermotogota bacterium]HOO74337.1 protein-glutamate O-methyltransferase CheR [Tepiditoga sp.]
MNESIIYNSPFDDRDYEKFLLEIKNHFQLDLSGYKQHRVRRRIDMLMRKHSMKTYSDYMAILKKDDKLWDEFLDKLTINVTEFFRNPEKWEYVEKTLIPTLNKDNPSGLKIWSAGCSTGEEPYTISIILDKMNAPASTKITAADLDKFVLQKAKDGIYDERSLINLDSSMKSKYFQVTPSGKYQVKPDLKKRITFKQLNLLTDKFDSGYDLIICRNVVIYFDNEAKEKLYKKFSDALRPGGVLFVGSTERIFNYREIGLKTFSPFFYQKEK